MAVLRGGLFLASLGYAASPFGGDAQIFYLAISENKMVSGRYSFMSFVLLSVHWRICFDVTH